MKFQQIFILVVCCGLTVVKAQNSKEKSSNSPNPNSGVYDTLTTDAVRSSFRTESFVGVDRVLAPDETNKLCSAADVSGLPLSPKVAKRIQDENLKSIKWPSDGKYLGDWNQGELIAQSGRGQTWTDKATDVNGGNCYNCHQLDKKEISFGTIGPSLYNYGKLRGVTNPASPEAKAIVQYTWGKIWNAKAYNACSNMPRAGHTGVLTEQQIRHIMALLLDPKSPVNQ